MSVQEWRKEKRQNGGSVKTINGILYARIQYIDETTGKRKEKLRRADNRRHARELVKDMRKELSDGGQTSLNSDKMTFKELAQKFEKSELVPATYEDGRKTSGRRSIKPLLSALKPLLEHFGRKSIRAIKISDIRAYKSERLNTPVVIEVNHKVLNDDGTRKKFRIEKVKQERPRKIATVNRELALLRQIFNFAKSDDLVTKSPFENQTKVISLSAETERDRVLSHAEEKRLIDACVDKRTHLKPLIIVAVDTAMRRGEMLKIRWRDVNFITGIITIEATNTKTQEERQVGMTTRVRDELTKLWEISPKDVNEFVFGIRNNFKRAWKSACEKAGIEGLTFHSLRHTAVTRLVRANIPHAEVMKISGHKQFKTFLRYTNQTNESVSASASMLESYLSGQQIDISDVQQSDAVN